jgi:hypothetical protein
MTACDPKKRHTLQNPGESCSVWLVSTIFWQLEGAVHSCHHFRP